jgi:hypothetical protein
VKAYAALCRGQAICRGKSTRKKLEKVKGFATGLHCVKVFEVDESRQSPWLRKQRGVGDIPEEGAGIGGGGGGSDDDLGNGGSDDNLGGNGSDDDIELELELIQTHMAQKPMLRVEVDARV